MKFFSDDIQAKLALMLSAILWSSAFVCIRYGMQTYSATSLALLRYLVASGVMWFIYHYSSHQAQAKSSHSDILLTVLLGIIGFAVYNIFLNYAEHQIKASIVSFIVGMSPILVPVSATWMYKESLSLQAKIGLVISLVGLSLTVANELQTLPKIKGICFALIAMLSLATYSLLKKRIMTRMDTIRFTSYAIWGGTASMLIFTPQLFCDVKNAPIMTTSIIIYLGIFPGALAYLFSNYGYNKMPVTNASAYSYLIPLFAAILSFVFLREIPSFFPFLGEICIFMGAMFITTSQIKVLN